MNPPGMLFEKFLDSVYQGKPIKIVETGCMRDLAMSAEYGDGWSTLYIARWVKRHPDCSFSTVDASLNALDLALLALESEHLGHLCSLNYYDSLKFLANQENIDFAFLDSCDGLQHGLDEFNLAVAAGAKLIVMDDFETKAQWAALKAAELGWTVARQDRYTVMRRPN